MRHFPLLLALALPLVSAGCHTPTDTEPLATRPDITGEWDGGGRLMDLVLEEDGGYETFVMNGMVDGCLTVRGAGSSVGRWYWDGELVRFRPDREPQDIVLSMADVHARAEGPGLRVFAEGKSSLLLRRGHDSPAPPSGR